MRIDLNAPKDDPQWKFLASTQRFTNQSFAAAIDDFVDDLISELAPMLNKLNGTSYSHQFWERYLRYWLTSFIDTVFVEWLDISTFILGDEGNQWAESARTHHPRAICRMQDALEASQNRTWRQQLQRDIWGLISYGRPVESESAGNCQPRQIPRVCHKIVRHLISLVGHFAQQKPVVIATTYLPLRYLVGLSIAFRTLPTRWIEPQFVLPGYSEEKRRQLLNILNVSSHGGFNALIRALLPSYLPRSVVESFPVVNTHFCLKQRKTPCLVLTDNLHFASDTFSLWLALQREKGAIVGVSQHGGLNGQGLFPTRDEQIEQRMADAYLHWGWSRAVNGVLIPTQLARRSHVRLSRRIRTGILIVTDTTFRFQRKYWSDSGLYKKLVLRTYRSLPEDLRTNTTVRLHRDHSRYDDSHQTFWLREFPEVQLEFGTAPIHQIINRARIVICTTFGTTEIECFLRNTPVLLSLDRNLHQPRPGFSQILRTLESVGLAHYSEESLQSFLVYNFDSLEHWWRSKPVQDAVAEYLKNFGHYPARPIREYCNAVRNLLNSDAY